MKTLGERIRERREELDLSLREFAKRLECSPPFVSDVEHGRRYPSDTMLEQMAHHLGLKVQELRQHDPRAPLDEMRRLTERDPTYAMAFRTMVDRKFTSADLMRMFEGQKPTGKRGSRK